MPHLHPSYASPRDYDDSFTSCPTLEMCPIASFLQLPLLPFTYFTPLAQAVGGGQLGGRRRKETLAIERIGGDSIILFYLK